MKRHCLILGCGPSGGVPRIGGYWGACDPHQTKNHRTRCSIVLEQSTPSGSTRVLVDASPDLRAQFLRSALCEIDAVVFTHEHADHTHGIDDLRVVAQALGHPLEVWSDGETAQALKTRFAYCFEGSAMGDYPPILTLKELLPGVPFTAEGKGGKMEILPFELIHGAIPALGLRCGGLAYTPDVSAIPDYTLPFLKGLDLWIVDALQRTPHPSHFTLNQALEWIDRLSPKRSVLTNLNTDMDYQILKDILPHGVEPAFDGQVLFF